MNNRTWGQIADQITARTGGDGDLRCPLCGGTDFSLSQFLLALISRDTVLEPRFDRTTPFVSAMCKRCFNTLLFPLRSFALDDEAQADLGYPRRDGMRVEGTTPQGKGGDGDVP